jgi:hypothetical protein
MQGSNIPLKNVWVYGDLYLACDRRARHLKKARRPGGSITNVLNAALRRGLVAQGLLRKRKRSNRELKRAGEAPSV